MQGCGASEVSSAYTALPSVVRYTNRLFWNQRRYMKRLIIATRCLARIVLYRKVDAQCDELHGQEARRPILDRRKNCQLNDGRRSNLPH